MNVMYVNVTSCLFITYLQLCASALGNTAKSISDGPSGTGRSCGCGCGCTCGACQEDAVQPMDEGSVCKPRGKEAPERVRLKSSVHNNSRMHSELHC